MVRCCSQRMQNNALEPVLLPGRQTAGPLSRVPSASAVRAAPGADLLAQPPQHLCRAPRHTPHFQLLCSVRKRSRACAGWQQAGRAQAGAGPQPRLHSRPPGPASRPAHGPGPGPDSPTRPPHLRSRPRRLAPGPGPPRHPAPLAAGRWRSEMAARGATGQGGDNGVRHRFLSCRDLFMTPRVPLFYIAGEGGGGVTGPCGPHVQVFARAARDPPYFG